MQKIVENGRKNCEKIMKPILQKLKEKFWKKSLLENCEKKIMQKLWKKIMYAKNCDNFLNKLFHTNICTIFSEKILPLFAQYFSLIFLKSFPQLFQHFLYFFSTIFAAIYQIVVVLRLFVLNFNQIDLRQITSEKICSLH